MAWRVVFTSADGVYVNQHFGHARCFVIRDIEADGTSSFLEQREITPVCGSGKHGVTALDDVIETLRNCVAVITAGSEFVYKRSLNLLTLYFYKLYSYQITGLYKHMQQSRGENMLKQTNCDPIRVQPGPANYYSYPGALEELGRLYPEKTLEKAFLLHGRRALTGALPYLPPALSRLAGSRGFLFGGGDGLLNTAHCSHELVDDLSASLRPDGASVIIGLGGGSVLDTAKALAIKLDLPFVAIPTIAATCAAATPLSVWYSVEGKALGFEVFNRAANAVLVEPRIILEAPADYLKAGLADTLAKWYEASILTGGGTDLPLSARLGFEVSATLKDVLLEKGKAAQTALETHTLSPEFIEVVDAIIIGGGLVGGLGERYTRVAAAHALHNGISVLSETHHLLHGVKVAYGLLVQAALMEDDSLAELVPKFRELELPLSLRDLGVDPNDKEKLRLFIDASLVPSESIHYLPFPIDQTRLLRAIETVEKRGLDTRPIFGG